MIKLQNRLFTKFDSGTIIPRFVFFLILSCAFVLACTDHVCSQLNSLERIIELDPEQVLSELQNVDKASLRTQKEKAKYSLLLSMALDKNYIDKTDFDLLYPAIEYYSKRGSSTDRLRTYLYQGNIYRNAGQNESAMECYSKALDFVKKNKDLYCLSRIYGSQAGVYTSLFNYDKSVESAKKAAAIMKEIKDTTNYFLELNTIVSGLLVLNQKDSANEYLKKCDTLWQRRRYSSQRDYFRNQITFSRMYISTEESINWVKLYLEAIPEKYVNWLVIADAYFKAGDIDNAKQAMDNYDMFNGKTTAGSEGMKAQILEARGDYYDSMISYKHYIHLSDSASLVAYRHNTRAIPQLHELEIERERINSWRLNLAIMLISALMLLFLEIIINRQRKEMSNIKISQLEEEYEQLKRLKQSETIIDEEAWTVLDERLALLNKFFLAYISDNGEEERKAFREIETIIADRKRFVSSTRKAFEARRPEFIRFLLTKGLNDKEINYCCLYVLGLKGSEVGRYMNDSRHYHVSSEVRAKLGLSPNDTNLGIFLRSLVHQMPRTIKSECP